MKHARAEAPALSLVALGSAAVSVGESGAPAALGVKALALVFHLAECAPRPVSRDALAALLWEGSASAQGRASLRQELRRIKLTLGPEAFEAAFEVSDSHLALREGRFGYDAAALSAAATEEGPGALDSLISLYGGAFLNDCAPRAEAFHDWARDRRLHYQDLVLSALCRLGEQALAEGRIEAARRAASASVAIDPLHEPGQELMIRCLLAEGRRGQAHVAFERFRQLMLREMAAEPQSGLAELVARQAAMRPAAPPAARRGAEDPRPSIAVLNVSRSLPEAEAYLADGVAEQLTAYLSRSPWIRVAALNASPFMPVAGEVDRSQRDLRGHAAYVLRVDVRAHQRRVSVLATLSRVEDRETIFFDETDLQIEDVLVTQRRLAQRIASIFDGQVIDDQSRRESDETWSEPETVDHWRLLMRARWLFWTTRPKANAEARLLLGKALKLNPRDVPAHCLLAFSHMLDAWSDWVADPAASVAEARRWARKAVQVAPNDGWAQFTLGVMFSTAEGLDQAKSHARHALTLSPSLVPAIGELARYCVFSGETEEARRLAEEALALSPYDAHCGLWHRTKALAAWIEGDLAKALEIVDFALTIRPAWFQNHYLRAAILSELGREGPARAALAEGERLMGSYSDAALRIGHPFRDPALLGRFVLALNKAGGSFTP